MKRRLAPPSCSSREGEAGDGAVGCRGWCCQLCNISAKVQQASPTMVPGPGGGHDPAGQGEEPADKAGVDITNVCSYGSVSLGRKFWPFYVI